MITTRAPDGANKLTGICGWLLVTLDVCITFGVKIVVCLFGGFCLSAKLSVKISGDFHEENKILSKCVGHLCECVLENMRVIE